MNVKFQISKVASFFYSKTPPRRTIPTTIIARKRSIRQNTDFYDRPSDPNKSRRSSFRSSFNSKSPPEPPLRKEPFEAELLVLFGLPAVIILIPWAVKEPAALAVIPIAFLVPGVREILLAVVRSMFKGVKKAKRFMREDQYPPRWSDDYNSYNYNERRDGGRGNEEERRRGVRVYDLSDEDFRVEDGPLSNNRKENDDWDDEEEEEDDSLEDEAAAVAVEEQGEQIIEEELPKKKARKIRHQWVSYNQEAMKKKTEEELAQGISKVNFFPPPPPRFQQSPAEAEDDNNEEQENQKDIEEELQLMERRRQRRQARLARKQQLYNALDFGGESSRSSRSSTNDEDLLQIQRRRSREQRALQRYNNNNTSRAPPPPPRRRTKRNIPFYLRPIVSLFPFLKDWGGFM